MEPPEAGPARCGPAAWAPHAGLRHRGRARGGRVAALWFRRRWPAGIAVAMLVPFVVSLPAAAAVLLALLNVSIRRRAGVALAIAVCT